MEREQVRPAIHSRLRDACILAVMVSNDPQSALGAGRALLRGGVRAVELALRTPGALDCAAALVGELPDLLVVAGTVLEPGQIDRLKQIGVEVAVAPGMNREVVLHAQVEGVDFVPGVCTPSDVEAALSCGCRILKYFPAEPAGGLPMLASMSGPYMHLNIEFIPLGGIKAEHLVDYLRANEVLAVGGSWICPASLVDAGNWTEIERRAREAVQLARSTRGGQ